MVWPLDSFRKRMICQGTRQFDDNSQDRGLGAGGATESMSILASSSSEQKKRKKKRKKKAVRFVALYFCYQLIHWKKKREPVG